MSADEEQSHEVALMQLGDDAPLQQKRQVGLNHMAWRLETLDDLKDFYKKIKKEGQAIDHIAVVTANEQRTNFAFEAEAFLKIRLRH